MFPIAESRSFEGRNSYRFLEATFPVVAFTPGALVAARARGERNRRWSVAGLVIPGRKDDKDAPWAFPDRVGFDARVVAEDEVEQVALAGVGRREGKRLAGAEGGFGGSLSTEAKLLYPESFEIVSVEGDFVMLFGLQADELGGNVFECTEKLAVARGEQGCIGARELDVDFAGFKAVGIGRAGAGGDAVAETKAALGGEQLEKLDEGLGSGLVVLDRHGFSLKATPPTREAGTSCRVFGGVEQRKHQQRPATEWPRAAQAVLVFYYLGIDGLSGFLSRPPQGDLAHFTAHGGAVHGHLGQDAE